MKGTPSAKAPSRSLIIAAFAALYLIWGSTYLFIIYAIRTIPPLFLVAFRFLIAGILLFAWCVYKGEKIPSFKTFIISGIGGVLMLFVGNGAVSWSEQYLPSGLAAIVVATVPLWFILLDKRQWSYHFSNKRIIIGILVGFAGVFMLFSGKASASVLAGTPKLIAFAILITGTIGWAIGSLYSKYKTVDISVTMKVAAQMLSAGVVALAAGFVSGENKDFVLSNISTQSLLALAYLVVMGSLVGYMSYIWLLSVMPASRVGTYAYVNPVVAVFLGWLFLNESITTSQVLALIIILAGVILVNFKNEDH